MAHDIFGEINNAVLDLQNSQLQTYERPLKKLAQLLRHPDLEPYKFKACLDVTDKDVKKHYDRLVSIKRQIRNYMAHGAFGKNGEAFQFHSGAGAVPLLMPHQKGNSRFSMQSGIAFDDEEAIQTVGGFMDFDWESKTFPEVIYIQSTLPSILPFVSDSTYAKAMASVEDMESFVDYLTGAHDNAANMDW